MSINIPEKLTCLDELSWADISAVGKAGKAREKFALGATKVDLMKNGFKAVWKIIGFDHDVDTDGNKVPISWDLTTIYRDVLPMWDDDHNGDNWADTVWREKLNGEILELMSDELQATIVPVVKLSAKSNGEIIQTVDKLWVKSEKEMFGRNIYSHPGEGEWYEYYRQSDVPYYVEDEAGDRRWAYLRSAYYLSSYSFCSVYINGGPRVSTSDISSGVALGFCC